ncbi:ribosome biogenesis GTP-binding protein YihA/YsxC [Pelobacter propionicus]|uniref:Probable GTP-binding protein EngB n=1 Tax=Pelobacter propionicus (strain DSM 2379 / NBRC 103807 / OttBd1) TaxID=338966 RepID=ENGB_PELPD|nr:ribosome biogenesis GTP-binding protein YihA/YsxC [Pelobacter propionicus]A1AU48.1 RecName: Full=Probable GTP-binding protein EngB [Pelobacter propionicus DSM 2379]ABL00869.1 small GTP-binding protein [Pelobacter propionicus DSM 2379]
MEVIKAEFIKSAVKPKDYPLETLPEVAFVGRSNVGKSSLINVLANRKSLVRTSSTPGRTQLINFFDINGVLTLVDLPGYGYAKAPPDVRKQWGPMIETYLARRGNLRAVVLILDIRRIPSDGDLQMLGWLETYDIPPIFVLTKCDKLSKVERAKQTALIASAIKRDRNELLHFSALSRDGRDAVWKEVLRLTLAQEEERI